MGRKRRAAGFTLIEVLIVVVIMAVLAATIIPQFSTSTQDAKVSALKFNLNTLRAQLELYKAHHGNYPAITGNLQQLTFATDATGAGTTNIPDATHPYGPYIQGQIPVNPFTGVNTVAAAPATGTPTATTTGGYFYRATTGEIWGDGNTAYLQY